MTDYTHLLPHFRLLRHDEPRRHWELEITADSEHKDWDVPRGPPQHPLEHRLAVERRTEAPAEVLGDCWDAGPCEVRRWSPTQIVVVLHGAKLKGCFALRQLRRSHPPHWRWTRVRPLHRRVHFAAAAPPSAVT